MKRIIVAYDKKRGIGADNDLLWLRDLPADMKHFRNLTMGGTVIMGRKTFESIGKPLGGRWNVVVSKEMPENDDIELVRSLGEAFAVTELLPDQDIWIIGGASIYEQALPFADEIIATEVDAEFPQATVFFPEMPVEFKEVDREHHEADDANKYAYDFVTYQRV